MRNDLTGVRPQKKHSSSDISTVLVNFNSNPPIDHIDVL